MSFEFRKLFCIYESPLTRSIARLALQVVQKGPVKGRVDPVVWAGEALAVAAGIPAWEWSLLKRLILAH